MPLNECIVDFYCHKLHLAIEIDGYTLDYSFDKDENRQKKLESLGITFIRFSDFDVKRKINELFRAFGGYNIGD